MPEAMKQGCSCLMIVAGFIIGVLLMNSLMRAIFT